MYEFDRTNLFVNQELGLMAFDGGSIAAILEPKLDISEKFQLAQKGLTPDDVTFSVIAYADGSLMSAQITSSLDGREEHFAYDLTGSEEKRLWEMLEDFCRQTYGCSLREYPNRDLRMGGNPMQEVILT